MLKILIDRRLILEFFANREDYADYADFMAELLINSDNLLDIKITNRAFSNISSLPFKSVEEFNGFRRHIQENILTIEESHVYQARNSSIKDFESAMELECALDNNCGAIITLIPESYIPSLQLLSVSNLIRRMRLEEILEEGKSYLSNSFTRNYGDLNLINPLITKVSSFDNKDLRFRNIDDNEFVNYDFSGQDLSNCTFNRCRFIDCNFRNANLSNVRFLKAYFKNVDFTNANLESADLICVESNRVNYTEANLARTNFFASRHYESSFIGADLSKADLSRAELKGADLKGANLSSANLSYAALNGSNLTKVNFRNANLRNANLSCCDTRNAIFIDAETTKAILK